MKKLLLIPFLFIPLCSCGEVINRPVQLTYGTLINEEATQLTADTFDTKVSNNENFLLTIYPKDSTCGCWRTFSYIINRAVKDEHLQVYKYYVQDIDSSAYMKNMGEFYRVYNAPTFYIIEDGKIAKSYKYNVSNEMYNSYEKFLNEVDARCYRPKIMEVNEEYLTSHPLNNNIICYARNSCQDSIYATNHALIPYFKEHTNKSYIYYFDLDPYRNKDMTLYQNKKDEYLLSTKNNPTFGFGDGVVPTYQYYKDGKLVDMCIYFNDGVLTYNQDDNCYYSLETYYAGERLNAFHYLDQCINKDLSKIKIPQEDTVEFNNMHFWKEDKAATYYNNILTCFLNTYLI